MSMEDPEKPYKKKIEKNRERFDHADDSLKTVPEMNALFVESEALLEKAMRGEIDVDEFEKRQAKINRELGATEVDTIMELRDLLLHAGYSEEDANYWCAHENAHANKAQELGLPVKYRIFRALLEQTDGSLIRAIMPAVQVGYRPDVEYARNAEMSRQIASAPDELSEGDRRNLDRFNKTED